MGGKNLRDMDKGEVESLMLHMTAEGLTDMSFEEGEMAVGLTPKGEEDALQLIGGKDVADVAGALTKLLVKCGDAMGGEIPDSIKTWLEMVQIARLWKQYGVLPWDSWVQKVRREILTEEV